MEPRLITAIAAMLFALTCYSVGVWGEKITGKLMGWHMIFFWIGFAADTTGTTLMSRISGTFQFNLHGVSGVGAILLMFVHAVWASLVLRRKNQAALLGFHRFSIFVWAIWLVPFFTGAVLAMRV